VELCLQALCPPPGLGGPPLARGWGRVDVMQDEAGQFLSAGVNTVRGYDGPQSGGPMALRPPGMTFHRSGGLAILASAR